MIGFFLGKRITVLDAALSLETLDRSKIGWPETLCVDYKGPGLYRRLAGCSSATWEKSKNNTDAGYDHIDIVQNPVILRTYRESIVG